MLMLNHETSYSLFGPEFDRFQEVFVDQSPPSKKSRRGYI